MPLRQGSATAYGSKVQESLACSGGVAPGYSWVAPAGQEANAELNFGYRNQPKANKKPTTWPGRSRSRL